MEHFPKTLKVTPLAGGIDWALLESFTYDRNPLGIDEIIEVEKGFITDFVSSPRFLWIIFPRWGKYGYAGVVHDYIYWVQDRSQKEADDILKEAMKVLEIPAWQRWIMYMSVKCFGFVAWRGNKRNKANGVSRILDLNEVNLDIHYHHKRPGLWAANWGYSNSESLSTPEMNKNIPDKILSKEKLK